MAQSMAKPPPSKRKRQEHRVSRGDGPLRCLTHVEVHWSLRIQLRRPQKLAPLTVKSTDREKMEDIDRNLATTGLVVPSS